MQEEHLNQRLQSFLLCREDNFLVTVGSDLYIFENQQERSRQKGVVGGAGKAEVVCCAGQSQHLSTAHTKGAGQERQDLR